MIKIIAEKNDEIHQIIASIVTLLRIKDEEKRIQRPKKAII